MSLSMLDESNSSNIIASNDVANVSWLFLKEFKDFACLKVEFKGVINVNLWMGISKGSGITCNNVWHVVWANLLLGHLNQLEFGFFWLD